MKRLTYLIVIALVSGMGSLAQQGSTPQQPSGGASGQQQKNAASASQDTSGTTGDQITKPAGAKESTIIGCLSGPDKDGRYTLHSMTYRSGVRVLGSDDLKNDSGSKVKLTGKWEASSPSPQKGVDLADTRRFQVTEVEVISKTCSAPGEATPVSKTKKQKATTYNAPSDSSK